MTEDDEREVREAIQNAHAEIQRIEADYLAHKAALKREHRRFFCAWGVGTALMLVNNYTIKDPTIDTLFQLACLAWVIQSVVDVWRITRKRR